MVKTIDVYLTDGSPVDRQLSTRSTTDDRFLQNASGSVSNAIMDYLLESSSVSTSAWTGITTVLTTIYTYMTTICLGAIRMSPRWWKLYQEGKKAADDIIDTGKKAADEIGEKAKKLADDVIDGFNDWRLKGDDPIARATDKALKKIEDWWSAYREAEAAVARWLQKIVDSIASAPRKFLTAMDNVRLNAASTLVDGFRNIGEYSTVRTPDVKLSWFKRAVQAVAEAALGVWNWGARIFSEIKSSWDELLSHVKTQISKLDETFMLIEDFYNDLKPGKFLKSIGSGVADAFSEIGEFISKNRFISNTLSISSDTFKYLSKTFSLGPFELLMLPLEIHWDMKDRGKSFLSATIAQTAGAVVGGLVTSLLMAGTAFVGTAFAIAVGYIVERAVEESAYTVMDMATAIFMNTPEENFANLESTRQRISANPGPISGFVLATAGKFQTTPPTPSYNGPNGNTLPFTSIDRYTNFFMGIDVKVVDLFNGAGYVELDYKLRLSEFLDGVWVDVKEELTKPVPLPQPIGPNGKLGIMESSLGGAISSTIVVPNNERAKAIAQVENINQSTTSPVVASGAVDADLNGRDVLIAEFNKPVGERPFYSITYSDILPKSYEVLNDSSAAISQYQAELAMQQQFVDLNVPYSLDDYKTAVAARAGQVYGWEFANFLMEQDPYENGQVGIIVEAWNQAANDMYQKSSIAKRLFKGGNALMNYEYIGGSGLIFTNVTSDSFDVNGVHIGNNQAGLDYIRSMFSGEGYSTGTGGASGGWNTGTFSNSYGDVYVVDASGGLSWANGNADNWFGGGSTYTVDEHGNMQWGGDGSNAMGESGTSGKSTYGANTWGRGDSSGSGSGGGGHNSSWP